ncbi:MAG: hypothetical protein JXB08_06310 [Bacilli bacterium]|nr:hypothetical protein [Bacilli bacterium]MBN2876936.1 hypothetical protein [Bacilli bacterium]
MNKKKLRLFRITGPSVELDQTLETFITVPCVYPIKSNEFKELVHGLAPVPTDNPWENIAKTISDIEKDIRISIPEIDKHTLDYSLDDIRGFVQDMKQKFHGLTDHRNDTEKLIKKYEDALTQVNNIIDLDISLDDIFSCEYVDARFGKLPVDSLDILKLYDKKPFVFQTFKQEKNYYWCMYMSAHKNEKEIDNIFSSVYFERVYIPDFVHGTPESARKSLEMEITVAKENLVDINNEIKELFDSNKDQMIQTKAELDFLTKLYLARKYVIALGDKFNISGFVHFKNADYLEQKFETLPGVEVSIMPADFDKRLNVPGKLDKNFKKACTL